MPRKKILGKPECWCGCGRNPSGDNDFAHGHDLKAAVAAILIDWGSVQRFVEQLGYGPGLNDASLDVTYHEHIVKSSGRKGRTRKPSR